MQEHIVTMMPRRVAPTSPTVPTLPAEFSDLTMFVPVWALATETERNKQRHAVGMEAITAFGAAMLPRVEQIVDFLDQYPIDALPPEGTALMQMLLSLAEVAPAIEFYRQPAVIDGYDPRRFEANESFVMRPAL